VGGDGVFALVTAATTAIALAAGVILGQYLAQPIKREGTWLESRIASPRMVGPLRGLVRRRPQRDAKLAGDERSDSDDGA
jgi:hypothetical protein